ncbi:MAG: hypothetical protein IT581_23785 [Verrucomicrobiales bacterium]|nr:hypothetical protein [Verrucomicrobiales bacterium]
MRPRSKLRRREWAGLGLLLLTAAVLAIGALGASRASRDVVTSRFSFVPVAQWQFGVKRLAHCSVQSPTFQGWDLQMGPLHYYYLALAQRPASPLPPAADTNATVTPVGLGPALEIRPAEPRGPTAGSEASSFTPHPPPV